MIETQPGSLQDVRQSAFKALVAAGEKCCSISVTRTTGRRRYRTEDGFRILVHCDPEFVPRDELGKANRNYVCIGEWRHRRKVIERYAAILRNAGLPMKAARPHAYKTRLFAWIDRPAMR